MLKASFLKHWVSRNWSRDGQFTGRISRLGTSCSKQDDAVT